MDGLNRRLRVAVPAGLAAALALLLTLPPLPEGPAVRPLDAYGWAALAADRHAAGAPAAEVAAALVLSMRAAPTDRPLLFARLPLAPTAWPALTPAQRAEVTAQVRLAWAVDRRRARAALPGVAGARLLARSLLSPEENSHQDTKNSKRPE